MRLDPTIRAVSSLAAAIAAMAALYFFPPDRFPFYPACPIHLFTGLLCPGCGATRSLAAILHGQFHEAWHQNALILFLLPLVVLYLASAFRLRLKSSGSPWPRISRPFVALCGMLTFVFTVYRNLPR